MAKPQNSVDLDDFDHKIIAALIAVVIVAAVQTVGTDLKTTFETISTKLTGG